MPNSIYDFKINTIEGEELDLANYKGKVLLIVNTASQCGFTAQYKGLEALYRQYQEQGLLVIGCPCNQFGQQEPGNAAAISSFCQSNFGVTFPVSEKIDVNGKSAHPLFRYLCDAKAGALGTKRIKWNFTKFLVNRQGEVIKRYAPITEPRALASDIAAALSLV